MEKLLKEISTTFKRYKLIFLTSFSVNLTNIDKIKE